MIETTKYILMTLVEYDHFPGFEIYVFLSTIFWIMITIHLHKIRKEITETRSELIQYLAQTIREIKEDK